MDGVETATTDADGVAELELAPERGVNQPDGTVEFDIKPSAGGEYADKRENTALLVVSE